MGLQAESGTNVLLLSKETLDGQKLQSPGMTYRQPAYFVLLMFLLDWEKVNWSGMRSFKTCSRSFCHP